jgi:acetylornithine deacetylase/succinyl-diaminopimelate desuccinylase-like protein
MTSLKRGHSSVPEPHNAIYQLAEALAKLSKFSFPLKTNDVTKNYFTQIAKIETGPATESLKQIGEGSVAAMEQVAAATVNCRVMPDDAPEYVLKTLQKAIGDEHVAVKTARLSAPGPSYFCMIW